MKIDKIIHYVFEKVIKSRDDPSSGTLMETVYSICWMADYLKNKFDLSMEMR